MCMALGLSQGSSRRANSKTIWPVANLKSWIACDSRLFCNTRAESSWGSVNTTLKCPQHSSQQK